MTFTLPSIFGTPFKVVNDKYYYYIPEGVWRDRKLVGIWRPKKQSNIKYKQAFVLYVGR